MATAADGLLARWRRRPVLKLQQTLSREVGQSQREGRYRPGGGDARQRADAVEGFAEEVGGGRQPVVAVVKHLQRHRVRRGKAQVDVHQAHEALHEQTRADEQHQREGDFRHHQHPAQPLVYRAGAGALPAEQVVHVLPDDLQGGRHPARQGRQPDETDGEPEEPRVHGDLPQTRHVGRHERRDRIERDRGEREAADAAEDGDHGALRQQLAQQAAASAAYRHPHRELRGAPRAAGQHQVGDVDARDQQDEQHRALEQQQRRLHRFDLARLQRDDARADVRVRARVLLGQPGRDGVHLCPRFLERHVRTQPSDHVPPAVAAARSLELLERLGCEEVTLRAAAIEAELEVRAEHPDHGVRLAVQHERAPDDVRLAPEAALPQTVRQNDDAAARPVLFRQEGAPVHGVGAEQLEETFRDARPQEILGLAGAAEVHRPGIYRRHAFEAPGPISPVPEVRRSDIHGTVAVVRIGLPERHEAFRVGEGWRLEKHGVDDGEDGRRRADRQRQRQYRGGGEAGVPAQQPQTVADVPAALLPGPRRNATRGPAPWSGPGRQGPPAPAGGPPPPAGRRRARTSISRAT